MLVCVRYSGVCEYLMLIFHYKCFLAQDCPRIAPHLLQVAEIAKDLCLSVSAWQDGIVYQCHPFPRSDFPNKEVFVCAWKNVWETGRAGDIFKLANAGYKVFQNFICSHHSFRGVNLRI